jgi:hypothetical protein
MAGATSPQLHTEMERETRRTPVRRNKFYEPIKVWESTPVTEAESRLVWSKSKESEDNLVTA